MDKKQLKSLVARIRKNCESHVKVSFIAITEFARACEQVGLHGLNSQFWQRRCRERDFPAIMTGRQWHIRRDYAEEFLKIMHAESS